MLRTILLMVILLFVSCAPGRSGRPATDRNAVAPFVLFDSVTVRYGMKRAALRSALKREKIRGICLLADSSLRIPVGGGRKSFLRLVFDRNSGMERIEGVYYGENTVLSNLIEAIEKENSKRDKELWRTPVDVGIVYFEVDRGPGSCFTPYPSGTFTLQFTYRGDGSHKQRIVLLKRIGLTSWEIESAVRKKLSVLLKEGYVLQSRKNTLILTFPGRKDSYFKLFFNEAGQLFRVFLRYEGSPDFLKQVVYMLNEKQRLRDNAIRRWGFIRILRYPGGYSGGHWSRFPLRFKFSFSKKRKK